MTELFDFAILYRQINIENMEQNYLLKLTIAGYKISDLFPEKEPLRWQIKESMGKILFETIKSQFLTESKTIVFAEIQALKTMLDISESQNWINSKNILILKQEYDKLAQEMRQINRPSSAPNIPQKAVEIVAKPRPQRVSMPKLSPEKRQERIVSMLNFKKRINLSDLKKIFPQVGSRTLRRDMEALLHQGLITRKRDGQKDVTYQVLQG
ncbi:MAG: DeoR family transcriptional regulator [Candidatus Paceibacterota bacterium]